MKHALLGIPVAILYITKYSVGENRFDELDIILNDFQESFLSLENKNVFEKAVKSDKIETRSKRDMPTMYMGKKKKLRTCANMNGILGGSNAFNYISFVLAILTLVVNTNNNINNNNNNLNQVLMPSNIFIKSLSLSLSNLYLYLTPGQPQHSQQQQRECQQQQQQCQCGQCHAPWEEEAEERSCSSSL